MAKTVTTASYLSAVAFSSALVDAVAVTATTNFMDVVSLSVVNGVNAGTIQLQAAEIGAGTLTIQPGSYCVVI
jgi:hypothetical protein